MKADAGPSRAHDLKELALEHGFMLAGICRPEIDPRVSTFYREWIAAGHHGEMAYLARHAELRQNVEHLLPRTRSVLAVAINYCQSPTAQPGAPKIARYALGRDYHRVIRSRLRRVMRAFQSPEGFRICVDSAPVLERWFAHQAGIGWFGKNTMLINSKRGSWFLLGIVLLQEELEPDAPALGGCGSCSACIDSCPTGAIQRFHDRWAIVSEQCISYQTIEKRGELTQPTHGWTFGCDVCQEVCPFNQPRASQPLRAEPTPVTDFLRVRQWPNLERLSVIDEAEWDRCSEGSPLRRATLLGIRRNAKAVLKEPQ